MWLVVACVAPEGAPGVVAAIIVMLGKKPSESSRVRARRWMGSRAAMHLKSVSLESSSEGLSFVQFSSFNGPL